MTQKAKIAREYLLGYRRAIENEKIIKNRIKYIEDKKQEQREKYLNSNFPKRDKILGGKQKDLSDVVEKIMDIYDKEIISMVEELEKAYSVARSIFTTVSICNLESVEKDYIALRFFEGKSNSDIRKTIGYSERGMYNIRKKALQKVGDKIEENKIVS